jgi:hypothetical protein
VEHWLFGLGSVHACLVHPLWREERRMGTVARPGTLLGPEGTGASLAPHGPAHTPAEVIPWGFVDGTVWTDVPPNGLKHLRNAAARM